MIQEVSSTVLGDFSLAGLVHQFFIEFDDFGGGGMGAPSAEKKGGGGCPPC